MFVHVRWWTKIQLILLGLSSKIVKFAIWNPTNDKENVVVNKINTVDDYDVHFDWISVILCTTV